MNTQTLSQGQYYTSPDFFALLKMVSDSLQKDDRSTALQKLQAECAQHSDSEILKHLIKALHFSLQTSPAWKISFASMLKVTIKRKIPIFLKRLCLRKNLSLTIKHDSENLSLKSIPITDICASIFLKILEFREDNPHVSIALEHLSDWLSSLAVISITSAESSPTLHSESILVSAIVSAYNSEHLLPACLLDLQRQNLGKRLEVLVIDSASPQREGEIVRSFQDRIPNLHYLRTEERETLYAAWNHGVQMAVGRYVTNANTDDSHHPDALALLATALENHPEADLAYADNYWTRRPNDLWERRDPTWQLVAYPDYHPASSLYWCTLGPHPLWRRSVFDKIGLFDPTYRAAGDFEFQIRFTRNRRQAVHVPIPLSLFYQNPTGLSYADTTSAKEANSLQFNWCDSVEIDQLYAVNSNDTLSVAAAWAALGRRGLSCWVPWWKQERGRTRFPKLAQRCFLKAHTLAPLVKDYTACLDAVEMCIARQITFSKVLKVAFPNGIHDPDLFQPKPATIPLRWMPGLSKNRLI